MDKLARIKELYCNKAPKTPIKGGTNLPPSIDRLASLTEDGRVLIRFRKAKTIVDAVKKITNRKYEGERRGFSLWSAPFTLEGMYYLRKGSFRITKELQEKEHRATQPKKLNLDFSIPELKKDLFHYQHEGVAFIEANNGSCIVGDEPGLGKTAQSLAYLALHPEDRPAVIVCPASLKLNWAKEVFMWLPDNEDNQVYMLSGQTKQICEHVTLKKGRLKLTPCKMPDYGIFIINYSILIDWFDELAEMEPAIIIYDEAQAMKNPKALQTMACMDLGKQIPKKLPLTGTLIENKVEECFNALHLVRPDLFSSFWKFQQRYSKETRTKDAAKGLHKLLQLACIRRKKQDVLKDLPPKIKSVVPLTICNEREYIQAESNVMGWIKGNKGEIAANKAALITGLAKINTLKEIAVKGKIDACIGWIASYLDSGKKLVVFAEHKAVIAAIMKEFGKCAVKVDGSVTGTKRNEAVEAFQNNPKVTLFVGQLKAAGVGLTLTAASATATMELGWNPAAHTQADDRIHRIGQKECCNNYYLMAQGTIEEDLAYMLDEKAIEATTILDGEEVVSTNLLTALLYRMQERG